MSPTDSGSHSRLDISEAARANPWVRAGAASRAGHDIGTLGMIWAQDLDGVLGAAGAMVWRVPADFSHFRAATWGCPLIMGRTSYLALGQALPGRRNIVLSRSPDFAPADAEVASELTAALALVAGSALVWIAGGAQVYRQAIDLADTLVVSHLDLRAPLPAGAAVAQAPQIDPDRWVVDGPLSDPDWRVRSGDARWRITTYQRKQAS